MVYYRLVFLEGTRAELGTVATPLTAFRAGVSTSRGIDLCAPPFEAYRPTIASPVAYSETQALGRAMRGAEVEAFRHPSARDGEGGTNVGVLSPSAFGRASPRDFESWHCTTTRQRVELVKRGFAAPSAYVFERAVFLVDGRLPEPAP